MDTCELEAGAKPPKAKLTLAEFCEEFRIGRTTVFEMLKAKGGPPFSQLGAKLVIRREDAERWFDDRRRSLRITDHDSEAL